MSAAAAFFEPSPEMSPSAPSDSSPIAKAVRRAADVASHLPLQSYSLLDSVGEQGVAGGVAPGGGIFLCDAPADKGCPEPPPPCPGPKDPAPPLGYVYCSDHATCIDGKWVCALCDVQYLLPPKKKKKCCCPVAILIGKVPKGDTGWIQTAGGVLEESAFAFEIPPKGIPAFDYHGKRPSIAGGKVGHLFEVEFVRDWKESDEFLPCPVKWMEKTNRRYKGWMPNDEWIDMLPAARERNDLIIHTFPLGAIEETLHEATGTPHVGLGGQHDILYTLDAPSVNPDQHPETRHIDGEIIMSAGCPEGCDPAEVRAHWAQDSDKGRNWFTSQDSSGDSNSSGPPESKEFEDWMGAKQFLWAHGGR